MQTTLSQTTLSQTTLSLPIASLGLDPFIQAYVDSDLIGKIIYLFLLMLSFVSWTVLLYKWWIAYRVEKESAQFKKVFLEQKNDLLSINFQNKAHAETPNAFFIIYTVINNKAADFMKQNSADGLSPSKLEVNDFSILEAQAASVIASITKYLERNLYILSTIVTLAPFLGLLGTVYGILVTFAGLEGGSGSTQQILSGLSLALTTTVIGLINAIPALIGYNAIKNNISDFDHEMARFATEVLSTFDANYRNRGGTAALKDNELL